MQTGITCTHAAMSSLKVAYGKGPCALSADPPPVSKKEKKSDFLLSFRETTQRPKVL